MKAHSGRSWWPPNRRGKGEYPRFAVLLAEGEAAGAAPAPRPAAATATAAPVTAAAAAPASAPAPAPVAAAVAAPAGGRVFASPLGAANRRRKGPGA